MDQYTDEELAALRAEDRGPLSKRLIISFTVISCVSVCLRLFTRIRYHRIGWEDWTIVLSTLAVIATSVLQVLQVNAGNGKHTVFVAYPEGASDILKYLFFSIITYNISLTVTKISILLQYHRIFTLREMRIPVYAALAFISSWGVTTLLTAIWSCVPVGAFWDVQGRSRAMCVNLTALWYVNASVNIFTDILVAVIPVPGIWGLHIPKRQKAALLGILTIGWFVCIVSILRVYSLVVLNKYPNDTTFNSAVTAYWSSIEANLAIVCASLPTLKPLVVRIIPVFGTRHSSMVRGSTALSGNNHRLHKLRSKTTWRFGDDKEKLTSEMSPSRPRSLESGPSDPEQQRSHIYVTKQFEQHIENSSGPGEANGEPAVTTAGFLAPDHVK